MKRKRFVLMLAATLVAAMLAGCTKPKREVESWPSNPYALTGVPIITQAGQEAGAAGDATGEKVPETTRGTEETRPTKPLSTVPTETEKGVINHGHSIKDAGDYDNRLIRRTSDVILTEAQALKYLEDSVTLQPEGLSFRLTDTSDKSLLCFRPLEPKLEAKLNIVWNKYSVRSSAANLFLQKLQEKFSK